MSVEASEGRDVHLMKSRQFMIMICDYNMFRLISEQTSGGFLSLFLTILLLENE